jgi:hypothetical protein
MASSVKKRDLNALLRLNMAVAIGAPSVVNECRSAVLQPEKRLLNELVLFATL